MTKQETKEAQKALRQAGYPLLAAMSFFVAIAFAITDKPDTMDLAVLCLILSIVWWEYRRMAGYYYNPVARLVYGMVVGFDYITGE